MSSSVHLELRPRTLAIWSVDDHFELGTNDGGEFAVPNFARALYPDTLIPIALFVCFWSYIYRQIDANFWTNMKDDLNRRRLVNLSTSLTHSSFVSIVLLIFFWRNTLLVFESPLHYYSYFGSLLIMCSIGYFIYDAMDMYLHDTLTFTNCVLYVHHCSSTFVLMVAVVSRKFLLYAYWALLMEISSVFLQLRSIYKLTGNSKNKPTEWKLICYLNIAVFVVFRFFVQIFQMGWALVNLNNMHSFYRYVAFLGGLAFFIQNVGLFQKLLQSDIYGSKSKSRSKKRQSKMGFTDDEMTDAQQTPLTTSASENKELDIPPSI